MEGNQVVMIKQVLNTFAVCVCGIAKVPQIRQLASTGSTEGLSFLNLCLELYCWSVSASYFTFNNYAYTDYLEYPLLLIQQLLLVSMYLRLNKLSSNLGVSALIIAYLGILYQATLGPSWLLVTLINLNAPIGAFGKLCQIYEIFKTKRSDNVSTFPFTVNALTSAARIITVMIETQDINLYITFGVSVVLNLAVVLTAFIYRPTSKKVE